MKLIGAQRMVLSAVYKEGGTVEFWKLAELTRLDPSDLRDWLVTLLEKELLCEDAEVGVVLTELGRQVFRLYQL